MPWRPSVAAAVLAVLAAGQVPARAGDELPVPPAEAKGPGGAADAGAAKDAPPPETGEVAEHSPWEFAWENGLVGGSADKSFRFHAGGRIDFDSGWYRAPADLQARLDVPLLDGSDFRRFRLETDGTLWTQVDFKLEADFSRASDFKGLKSEPQTNIFITDAWLDVKDLPVVGTVRAGHQKEYLTFSNASSALFTPFLERPYLFDAFENDFGFDNGVSMSRTYFDKAATSWVGVFWNGTRSQAFNVGGDYAVSGRLTLTPVYDEPARRWVNLSVSGSLRSIESNFERVTTRPLVRTGESFEVPNLIDTGNVFGRDGLRLFGAGAHSAWGPLTVGSEYLCRSTPNAFVGGPAGPDGRFPPGAGPVGDLFFDGVYVEVLCFLTPGDHRPLNRETPGYDRVVPVQTFFLFSDRSGRTHGGPGAWELATRYDHVNVDSGLIRAGKLDSVTVGLNWYLNGNARVMADYVHTWRSTDAADDQFDALGVRVHLDF